MVETSIHIWELLMLNFQVNFLSQRRRSCRCGWVQAFTKFYVGGPIHLMGHRKIVDHGGRIWMSWFCEFVLFKISESLPNVVFVTGIEKIAFVAWAPCWNLPGELSRLDPRSPSWTGREPLTISLPLMHWRLDSWSPSLWDKLTLLKTRCINTAICQWWANLKSQSYIKISNLLFSISKSHGPNPNLKN